LCIIFFLLINTYKIDYIYHSLIIIKMSSYLKKLFSKEIQGEKKEIEIEFDDDVFLGEKVYENDKWSLYVADAREFINSMKNWELNC
jgi:hypothetical protein